MLLKMPNCCLSSSAGLTPTFHIKMCIANLEAYECVCGHLQSFDGAKVQYDPCSRATRSGIIRFCQGDDVTSAMSKVPLTGVKTWACEVCYGAGIWRRLPNDSAIHVAYANRRPNELAAWEASQRQKNHNWSVSAHYFARIIADGCPFRPSLKNTHTIVAGEFT